MQQDPTRLPKIILTLLATSIFLSVVFIVVVGAGDHDPALSPAFIFCGLLLSYIGWLHLGRPDIVRLMLAGSQDRLAGVPYAVRGTIAMALGVFIIFVGIANLLPDSDGEQPTRPPATIYFAQYAPWRSR
jgi:hypothetical protein